MLSMVANRRQDLTLADADLLIEPALPPGVHWTRWDRHTEVFICAYEAASAALRRQIAGADPRVAAIIAAAKPPDAARQRLEQSSSDAGGG
jgi:hypothetical protein